MKHCSKCGIEKPLDDFYAQKGCRDGRRPDCKDCIKAIRKAHREANLERMQEYDRERYASQPGRAEANRRSARKSYWENREALRETKRAYYLANPEIFQRGRIKRRAAERGVEHQPYSRREIWERDGGKCRACGVDLPYVPNGFHIDHIVPVTLGGPDTPANVQLMCPPCNRSKWANLEGQIHFAV